MDEGRSGFPRVERLRKRRDFLEAYARGGKIHTPFFVIYVVENQGERHRLGLTVSRRIGKAVIRNRIKRRLREIFRLNKARLAVSSDWVINVKRSSRGATWRVLEGAFREALDRWNKRKPGS